VTSQKNNNSLFERLMLWRNSLLLAKEQPLTGIGTGNWKIFYSKYGIGGPTTSTVAPFFMSIPTTITCFRQ
jgi:O-antigen ligase